MGVGGQGVESGAWCKVACVSAALVPEDDSVFMLKDRGGRWVWPVSLFLEKLRDFMET